MKLVANPPTPWPNWQAPVSTRKTRPAIMERAVEGKGLRLEHKTGRKKFSRAPTVQN